MYLCFDCKKGLGETWRSSRGMSQLKWCISYTKAARIDLCTPFKIVK